MLHFKSFCPTLACAISDNASVDVVFLVFVQGLSSDGHCEVHPLLDIKICHVICLDLSFFSVSASTSFHQKKNDRIQSWSQFVVGWGCGCPLNTCLPHMWGSYQSHSLVGSPGLLPGWWQFFARGAGLCTYHTKFGQSVAPVSFHASYQKSKQTKVQSHDLIVMRARWECGPLALTLRMLTMRWLQQHFSPWVVSNPPLPTLHPLTNRQFLARGAGALHAPY